MSDLAEITAAVSALRHGLEEQRLALLRGDPQGLEAARLLLELALREGARLRGALKAKELPRGSQEERAALHASARALKQSAQDNARLLVRSRDLTKDLLDELKAARPSLDARA
ncbi:MAG: hypothetical protein R3F62_12205 [Planctomycetota bacterium]